MFEMCGTILTQTINVKSIKCVTKFIKSSMCTNWLSMASLLLACYNNYMAINKMIHMYFSHITYLISHVTSLNNTSGWSYKLPHSGL